MTIDELDQSILTALMVEGRVKWSALAERFGVSAPAIADRVRRLEKAGVLVGYTARLNSELLGFGLTAFVMVTLEHPQHRQRFVDYVNANNRVQSCHHVVGDGDYLLKVCCRSTAELEQLLSEELKALPGVRQTRTTISLRAIKDTAVLPIEEG
ncbi:MAG: Lrp/AsnC family transcriptional regulator [Cyanobacteria bacterium P01_D01_bin.1]